jgi:hypothetical protein
MHRDEIMTQLRSANFEAEIVEVPYEFQKGGGQRLGRARITEKGIAAKRRKEKKKGLAAPWHSSQS